jgi:hypothetical protein
MRKVVALLVSVSFILIAHSPAFAATKPTLVKTAFQKLLNVTADSIDALEQKYEADVDALDVALANSTIDANTIYDQEIQAASGLYSPQISASTLKMSEARVKFKSVSSVKVLALGTNRNYWGNLNCPTNRPDCKDVDKGEKFNVDEVTTLKEIIATKTDYLLEIDIMLGLGLIELVNRAEYSVVTSTLKNEPSILGKITDQYTAAQSSAKNKRDRSIEAATTTRLSALADLNEEFISASENLAAKEAAANLALLASKRAAKDPNNFDKAFAIAFKFEYNRQMVNEIADTSWSGQWTYRTIDSIIKVSRLANTGDAIAARYSMQSGSAFNSSVGNAFTNEPDFRAALKVLVKIYQQTTKTTLKV